MLRLLYGRALFAIIDCFLWELVTFNLLVAAQQVGHIRHGRQDYLHDAFTECASYPLGHAITSVMLAYQAYRKSAVLQGHGAVDETAHLVSISPARRPKGSR